MKVLVIDEWLPWPLESGKKIRSFNLIARLAARHEIIYLAYANLPQEEEKVSIMENRGIHVIPVKDDRMTKWTSSFYIRVIFNLFSKTPFSTVYHIKQNFIKTLKEVMKADKPELVHCEWTNLAPFLEHISGVPRVITAHNVESEIWKRLARNTRNPLIRLIGCQQSKKMERLEREWYPRVEKCIAVSDRDRQIIESYGAKVSVIDNGVDIGYYDIYDAEAGENRLIFPASFDVFTNQDAVHFFMKEILPLVTKGNAAVSFWIVGKDPPRKITSYGKRNPRVHVTGTVADIREYIAKSSICVVPIRIGGGSRLKILEAMAMRRPVVSTSIGAEGLKIKDGENILLADTPSEFAESVLKLLMDPSKRRVLSEKGSELVKKWYDWNILAMKQEIIWQSLAN